MSEDRSAQYEYEWYPTPRPFIRWLAQHLPDDRGGTAVYAEPCCGDSVICVGIRGVWVTNDLNPAWAADTHLDATKHEYWVQLPRTVEGIITNPANSIAWSILQWGMALRQTPFIALHLRLSFLEPLKMNSWQRTMLRDFPPSMILPLPRFPYQRNKHGAWSQDTVSCCWAIWNPASDAFQMRVTQIIGPSEQLMQETATAAQARRRGLPEMDT